MIRLLSDAQYSPSAVGAEPGQDFIPILLCWKPAGPALDPGPQEVAAWSDHTCAGITPAARPSTDLAELTGHSDLLCSPCFDKVPFKGGFAVKLIPLRGARSLGRSCTCE